MSKNPSTYKDESWRDKACKKCKSEALDYGVLNHEDIEDSEDI